MNFAQIKRQLSRVAIGLAVVLVLVAVVEACPGCKDAIAENDPNRQNVVRGYFWSILFMMSMPFAILGTFGTYVYLEVRRARSDQARRDDENHDPTPP